LQERLSVFFLGVSSLCADRAMIGMSYADSA